MTDTGHIWLNFQYAFQGVLIFQILFMVSQYVAVRRLEYLFNALYLGCMSVYFVLAAVEFSRSYDTYNVDETWTFRHFNVLTLFGYLMYYKFFRHFFEISTTLPHLLKWFSWVENTLWLYLPIHLGLLLVGASLPVQANIYMVFSLGLFGISIWLLYQIARLQPNLGTRLVILGSVFFALGSLISLILTSIIKISNHEWGLVIGLLLDVICLSLALAYKSRVIEKEKNSYQQQFLQNEMQTLRSQMNPHFIFNCLNAVKSLVLQKQIEAASAYISKFSRLVRLVLENSRSEWVTLEQELETLTLYLDIEQMRFNNRFHYWINLENDVDTEGVKLPPMLIQPYVENAIWHGLMHKEEGGNVTISITEKSNNQLEINILDDGVGRKRAMELKSKSATQRKSFGMEISADRLKIINQIYNVNAQVFVHDLTDERTGEATGTRVQLILAV
jgi:sensor histidine kinase YesM